MNKKRNQTLPRIGMLYLDHVLRFFDKSNFKNWPDKIETVVYHWGKDKQRFINEVKKKKIDVLIGNVPATAYETFREISIALPEVEFIPSLDTQFSNKSKENVTHFCEKYNIPIPKTRIFYEPTEADAFLKTTEYPKIIKKSYGPSNYGGYFVHKVDSYEQASGLLKRKKYHPVYLQDFVPMAADIRVMLIGHKPVCAFWRRPPEGEWLTNTSQGGSMDYQNVPQEVLDLAVKVSKAANAEYWACDVAVGVDGKYRILECATAFAAFPYIRDWIGQYLMWKLSDGQFNKPYIPLYNWEELSKISSSVLRTMRYITFGQQVYPSCDGGELFTELDDNQYPIMDTCHQTEEEWPSDIWNRQDNYRIRHTPKVAPSVEAEVQAEVEDKSLATEPLDNLEGDDLEVQQLNSQDTKASESYSADEFEAFFSSIKGFGQKQISSIFDTLPLATIHLALENDGTEFYQVKNIGEKKVLQILTAWKDFKPK